jgi:hypothetical protein
MKSERFDNFDDNETDVSPPQAKKRRMGKQTGDPSQMAPDSNGKPKLQKGG